MEELRATLLGDPRVKDDALAERLVPVLLSRAELSSGGFPFLPESAYAQFRDTVPHVLGMAPRVLRALEYLESLLTEYADEGQLESTGRAARVIRTMLNTATITAPPDLWVIRHLLGALKTVGLADRLLAGEIVRPESCEVALPGGEPFQVEAYELGADLRFLQTRGYVQRIEGGYVAATGARPRDVLRDIAPIPAEVPAGVANVWTRLVSGENLDPNEVEILKLLVGHTPVREDMHQETWVATLEEVELGYRILPLVVAMHSVGLTADLTRGGLCHPRSWNPTHPDLMDGVAWLLEAAGAWTQDTDGGCEPTAIGRRMFLRGPGPYGILDTYHPYMARLVDILRDGREAVWVNRSANVAASQDANRNTFLQTNDALDAFCKDTGFTWDVFIEHALGRGEATRQRWEREGDRPVRYFGADLEDASIDAALEERDAGHLPPDMVFIRNADIGAPDTLIAQIRATGAKTEGAVMMVGNGFHEVRNQTDEKMARVFRTYQEAGIILLFTEASALQVQDLLNTAWNTYHAGFMYVHAKSGQGLRPASPIPAERRSGELQASWVECATAAGYVRADAHCSRSRTAYPTRPGGQSFNPAISANHFFVPGELGELLGLD